MFKKVITLLLVLTLFSGLVSAVSAASSDPSPVEMPVIMTKNVPKVYVFGGKDVNGTDLWREFKFSRVSSYVDNGVLCIPLRCGFFELFGYESTYDWLSKECVIKTETQLITMYAWKFKVYDCGEIVVTSDAYAAVLCNVAYVPLVPFLEALEGVNVVEDKDSNAIYVRGPIC